MWRWWRKRRGELEEAAFTYPLLLLLSIGLFNLALFGYAGLLASNAANYGARMGSVAQENPAALARQAAMQGIAVAPVGQYRVRVVAASERGGEVQVIVDFTVPNYFKGLASWFGVNMSDFHGQARATFRKEGW